MKRYNLMYSVGTDVPTLQNQLISAGVEIINILHTINVITVLANDDTFSNSIEAILVIEEDGEVIPESAAEWHQLRIATRDLPMKENYIPQNYGEGATVYLMDSGIDVTHSEFENADITNLYSFDDTFTDETGHGTGIASMILGKTLGIATQTKLKVVKIPMNDTTTLSVLLKAFDAIAADKTEDIAVINCSWHIPKSQILDAKITELQNLGFIVVAAAGNTVSDADNLSPVGLNTVIGVGASDAYDRVVTWNEFGAGSNWGEEVDVFAPGIDVNVATLNDQIVNNSGTSIAAGIVSGIVAQYVTAKEDFRVQLGVDTISAGDIQHVIMENAVSGVLFRNEIVYGTTPNRLINGLTRETFFTNAVPERVVLIPGVETYTLQFDVDTNFVESINIEAVKVGMNTFSHPDWITHTAGTYSIELAPPEGTENKKHRLVVEFLDASGTRLSLYSMKIVVSDSSDPMEEAETYKTTIDEHGEVFVTQADCTSFCTTVCFDPPPFKGSSCLCQYNSCYTKF